MTKNFVRHRNAPNALAGENGSEHDPAKVGVLGSNLIARFRSFRYYDSIAEAARGHLVFSEPQRNQAATSRISVVSLSRTALSVPDHCRP